jgi:hypothetical protein
MMFSTDCYRTVVSTAGPEQTTQAHCGVYMVVVGINQLCQLHRLWGGANW